jgi:hypothetical protein
MPKAGLKPKNHAFCAGRLACLTPTQHNMSRGSPARREVEVPVPMGGAIGIHMGITRFATFSNGGYLAPLNSFKRHERALVKAQRQMSHKVKFSSNWRKAKARVPEDSPSHRECPSGLPAQSHGHHQRKPSAGGHGRLSRWAICPSRLLATRMHQAATSGQSPD